MVYEWCAQTSASKKKSIYNRKYKRSEDSLSVETSAPKTRFRNGSIGKKDAAAEPFLPLGNNIPPCPVLGWSRCW